MTVKVGFIMDPIDKLTHYKDSTMAMLTETTRRGWHAFYFTPEDLLTRDGVAYGMATPIEAQPKPQWYAKGSTKGMPLHELDIILMRKDPPFDMNYLYTTQILGLAEQSGAKVFNSPQGLRDYNEKLFINLFPQCCTPTIVTSQKQALMAFWDEHQTIIIKPLDGMGGKGIFKLTPASSNFHATCELLTQNETTPVMAQKFISEIDQGDKRILMINGEPIPYALARIPKSGDTRGNLAAGGKGVSQPLSDRDRWICDQVGPTLKKNNLFFVGIDVIGDYLTEINVTSPTCIKELDEQNNINISGQLFDAITQKTA